MGVSQNISGLKRDGPGLAIAPEVLTRRSLRRGARYGRKGERVALGVMTRAWSLRPRSLHADSCAGERVMDIKENG